MMVQATEVASAAKRAQAHETPGRGDMLPRFEVGFGWRARFCAIYFLFRAIVRSRCRRQSDDSSSGGAKMSNCEVVGIDGEGPSKHRERLFLPQVWLVLLSQSVFLASRRLLGLSRGVEYHRFSSQRIHARTTRCWFTAKPLNQSASANVLSVFDLGP